MALSDFMQLRISLKKSLEENANDYFEKSKKARLKLVGVEKAVVDLQGKLSSVQREEKSFLENAVPEKKRSREWFEKFHWFFSSNGFLVLGGKDAKSNEQVVKKHLEDGDVYFHADIQGAAHVVVKALGKEVPEQTKKEAASFAGVFSKAWQAGLASVDVYSAMPSQLSKSAPSGEALGTGAFMVYGKREWFKKTPLDFCVGVKNSGSAMVVVSGPESAVKSQAEHCIKLKQGKESKGKAAKRISDFFRKKTGSSIDTDEILQMLPAGQFELVF
jgi:predicted ribosome quality control (RQC) complex YloA/Tae2 family protein